MKFLVDECTGPGVARWLEQEGYEVCSVFDENRGISDDVIIQKAYEENWILITIDKDFGTKIYRDNHPHKGVILMRLSDERLANKIHMLERLLAQYSDQLHDTYVVVTENGIRFRK